MKYRLTDETIKVDEVILHRIECVEAFSNVKTGDKGGWIENESNLSQINNAWVFENARVYGNAEVYGNVWVHDNAHVYDNAKVYDNVHVFDYAEVCDNAVVKGYAHIRGNAKISQTSDYIVFQNNFSSGRNFTWTRSNNMWTVGCFHGTGEKLIEKARLDNEDKARCYALYVKLVEDLLKVELSLSKE